MGMGKPNIGLDFNFYRYTLGNPPQFVFGKFGRLTSFAN